MSSIPERPVSTDFDDVETPGVEVELSREEAKELGAFDEDALSEEDAREANVPPEPEAESSE